VDTTVADPLVGRVLEGRYAVQSRIARGGMATVYLAVDQRLDREVAIKVMHADLARDEDFLRRFIREARSAARLSHPGVVSVYDQGEDAGSWFLVMEYVPGHTLRDLLNERGRLTPREALALLDPVLDALAAAHWNGLIHRDIKPENVLLADDGRVKVADFGLARAVATSTSNQDSKVLLGTVAYLAPEQVERSVADARSDVYAIGILLFEMLTGRKPFEGDSAIQVAYQHVHSDVPAPSTLVAGLAPALDLLVQQATARDPDARPDDAGELLVNARRTRAGLTPDELDGVGVAPITEPINEATVLVPTAGAFAVPGGPPLGAAYPPPALHTPTGVLDLGQQPPAPPTRRKPKNRGRTAAIVIVLLALLLGVAGWYVGAGPGSKIPTPNVIDKTTAQAQRILQDKGLDYKVVSVFSETIAAGHVAATNPAAGKPVSKNGRVVLSVSKGVERYPVPQLVGQTIEDAEAAITGQHLAVGRLTSAYDDTTGKGKVISSDPPAGTQLAPNKAVDLVISLGPAPVKLDDWTGQPIDEATAALTEAGLKVKPTEKFNEKVAEGRIISQQPNPGTVHRGDTINFVVSKGPPLVDVPDVTGMRVDDAKRILHAAGFKVRVTSIFPFVSGDTVREQDPSGGNGKQATKGSTVTIAVL
jgi:beta-lactam-binding protein with PASTA domain/tRNA A-37 threonylcarbamoyl transferase component Bud32